MSVGSKIPVVVQWLCVGQHVAGQVKNQWGRFSIPHYFPWEEGRGLLRIIVGHLLQNNGRINRTKYFINEQSLLGHFSFWTSMYLRKNGGTVSLRSTTQVAISLSPAWDASTTSFPYKLWGMFSKKKSINPVEAKTSSIMCVPNEVPSTKPQFCQKKTWKWNW